MNIQKLAQSLGLKIDNDNKEFVKLRESYKEQYGLNIASQMAYEDLIFGRIKELVEKVENKGEIKC